ncbi:bifunctional metallophosphatase/5'-nucleotidase [Luteolibacter marinus]|uniref:bifunctional metallophosphatase/5'-nucleotidase n=1 Tax=Luteolibacter marinus TaxID=2776705 RepID=UPI001867BCDB|nr:bifunctional UDP-sugar hydrolase/5'-nucleotidase [Luteolibacter marinus]
MQDTCFVPVSRRRFLAAGGMLLGSSLVADAAALRRGKTVSIFHTTDLHGRVMPTENYDGVGDLGGLARCATQIRRWRKEFPDSILVDIGDVYQGTPASLQTGGQLMIELFNRLGYDHWVLGNHDFDWGRDTVEAAIGHSKCDVLTGNLTVDGKPTVDAGGVWGKVRPWSIREVGGFRIGMIGLITPGLPYWLAPATLGGVAATDPIESLKKSLAEIQSEKPDAVVVLGHMGWRFSDDYANPLREMLASVDGVDIYLAGHSHQDQPSFMNGRVLCSQASYYGIHCGRIDLTFDRDSRKLIDRRAFTVLMDSRFEFDPLVIEIAEPELAKADAQMKRKVCTVKAKIEGGGKYSEVSKLLCESFAAALAKSGTPVDGVFHGTFGRDDIPPGELTVADCWKILPYENGLLVAELTAQDLRVILAEDGGSRTLWPFEVRVSKDGEVDRFLLDGQPVDESRRFKIAFNTYDGQSGGRSLPKLHEILLRPDSKRADTNVATREAFIDYLLDRGEI